ncbi:hypothetical protein [Actinomyces capricornis]|uniref:Uncharacterized protein n=1 Tax=Actinomyces capricornis TaxID=2755559 RepID=A0ABN6K6L5_9ACTO|nr:hypothetical protein [Actinomyces capricornis]BDA65314.1 hypothetical protein MANAM107_21480 [Actinomyces capricornis]
MDTSLMLIKAALVALTILVVALIVGASRGARRDGPVRITAPVGPGGPSGAAETIDVPRQRPSGSMRVLGVITIACGAILVLIAAVVPDPMAVAVLGVMGAVITGAGVHTLRSYRNCSLVDAPTMTIMTTWRGREKRVAHEEITTYHAANRRTAVVRDSRGQGLTIDLARFSVPLLARHLMQLEAEGALAGGSLGDSRRITKGLSNVEFTFKMRFPDHYKALLLQGPGANPAAFQRDPAAPAGRGWAGPAYSAWLQALQATLRG